VTRAIAAVGLACVSCVACAGATREPSPPQVAVLPPAAPLVTAPAESGRRDVDLGEVRIKPYDQPTPDAEIRGQFFDAAQAMRNCWGARGARLGVDLVVALNGNVTEATVAGDNEIAARCVHDAFIAWRTFGTGEPLHVTATVVGEAAPLPKPIVR
jgi:hypothetical protein